MASDDRQKMPDVVYQQIAAELDHIFNGDQRPKHIGFALFVFPFGPQLQEGKVDYVSNADRADMLVAVREWLARAEGRVQTNGTQQ